MNRLLYSIAFAAVVGASLHVAGPASAAQAECVQLRNGETACPPPDTRCTKDRYGDWFCSGPGGDALPNRYGEPVCGVGSCIPDRNGDVKCSTQPRGAAALDRVSQAVCSGGCEAASASRCTKLTK